MKEFEFDKKDKMLKRYNLKVFIWDIFQIFLSILMPYAMWYATQYEKYNIILYSVIFPMAFIAVLYELWLVFDILFVQSNYIIRKIEIDEEQKKITFHTFSTIFFKSKLIEDNITSMRFFSISCFERKNIIDGLRIKYKNHDYQLPIICFIDYGDLNELMYGMCNIKESK
jgi:hypothetical protein